MAGTQLAQAFIEAKDVAKKFGFESSDLLDVIGSLEEKFGDNVDIMDHFTKRSGRAALVLRAAGDDAQKFQETLGGVGGEAKKLADKMRSTFEGTRKELVSVMESLKIDVFGLYEDSLKSTMRDTIEWLRRNKDEILAWADSAIVAFKNVWGVVTSIVELVASFVSGVTEMYRAIEEQSAKTADELAKDGEKIRAAFAPPDVTPLQEFWNALVNFGEAVVSTTMFVAKSVSQVLTGLVKFVVNDVLFNLIEAIIEASAAIPRILRGDLEGAVEAIKTGYGRLNSILAESDQTWAALTSSISKSWEDMMTSFDFRSVKEKLVDEDFTKALENAADEREVAAKRFAAARQGHLALLGGGVHQAKGVTGDVSVEGDDSKARKVAGALLAARVQLNRELLSADGKSQDERKMIWERYKAVRIEQMKAEHAALLNMGVEVGLVTEIVAQRMQDLTEEQRALFEDQGSWLTEWSQEIAAEMHASLSDMFFDVLKGEFTSLTDYLSSVWDVFLKKIADQAATELSDLFMPGGGGGGFGLLGLLGGGGGAVEKLQYGGVVTGPTLAMVGEVPEAVIPLNKMHDEAFLNRIGIGNGGSTVVNMNVQTPDLPSFKASKPQMMAELSVALRGAHRRNV
jgi:hypothetical protein